MVHEMNDCQQLSSCPGLLRGICTTRDDDEDGSNSHHSKGRDLTIPVLLLNSNKASNDGTTPNDTLGLVPVPQA